MELIEDRHRYKLIYREKNDTYDRVDSIIYTSYGYPGGMSLCYPTDKKEEGKKILYRFAKEELERIIEKNKILLESLKEENIDGNN